MSTKEFSVAFEGASVDDGTIDVADLAPTLLALGELFQASNRALNGSDTAARLNVRAGPRIACFEIDLQVALSFGAQLKTLLLGDGAIAAERLFDLIVKGSTAGGCLIALFTFLKRKKPENTTTLIDGSVQITVNDQSQIFSAEVVQLYNDTRVREAASKVVRPLQSNRIERIEFRDHRETINFIDVERSKQFAPIDEPDQKLQEYDREVALEVITATFDGSRLWRMSDGTNTFNVGVDDVEFAEKVETREITFGKGDVVRVELHTEQSLNQSGKLVTQHTIRRVIERIPAPQQIPMDLTGRSS